MKRLKDHVLLTAEEYQELKQGVVVHEVKADQLMTKTAARSGVKALLKASGFTCYHDRRPVPGQDDACCGECPVMTTLGNDCGERLCQRQKWWSQ
jgi:hypothetical protein